MGTLTSRQGIYGIKNIVTKKIYIGQAEKFNKRLSKHLYDLRRQQHVNPHLQRAWNKHGENSFQCMEIELVENVLLLTEREQYWMDFYRSQDGRYGYNIRDADKKHTKTDRWKKQATALLKYILEKYHPNLPRRNAAAEEERKHYRFICNRRKAKKGTRTCQNAWFPEFDVIAAEAGHRGLFDERRQVILERLREILSKNKLPTGCSADKQERKDAQFIQQKIQAKRGQNKSIWYPELEEIAKQYGFPSLFEGKYNKNVATHKEHI